ncbi:cell division protein FtsL [Jiella mangrovi]|uniref:Cell division protein FtsL n=1 Tax=Jiella mangrovi TaxID=2821407 RepID=A0ABS4BER8_9HYPH|nr:hypothetical protein [Jiella mangrovi]MBP0615249.1 hypothetical protein [Jiella mangrovi]
MLKTLNILLILVMLGAAAYTYKIKHDAELLEEAIAKVDRKISLERETISLLQADWTLLDQPGRLQRLIDVYSAELELKPIQPDQIVQPDELPAPSALPAPGSVPVPVSPAGRYAYNTGVAGQ